MTTTAPQSPTFIAELQLDQLRTHPSNPRRKAKADDDMVTSVKESGLLQPLLVAPTGDETVPYVLIDGHRRLDALKKARRKTAPANVRPDLAGDGDQVEAMILASLHREGLTPLEEAEAFDQLRGMRGFTQARISRKTGVPVATIRDRLKLLKLSKATQTRIHKGQLSLGDALELVSFDDDPDTQAKLVKAAGTWSWDAELHAAKRRRAANQEADRVEQHLLEQGTPRWDLPEGQTWWQARDRDQGPVEVEQTFSDKSEDHPACYAFVRYDDHLGPVVKIVCTDPASHAAQLDAAERARREEYAAEEAARRQAEQDHRVAADVRAAAVMKVADEVVLPAPVTDLLRALLPALIYRLPRRAQRTYGALVDDDHLGGGSEHFAPEWETFAAHTAALSVLTAPAVTRRLVAVLVATSEQMIHPHGQQQHEWSPLVERYYELLEQLDHHPSDVDVELLARHRGEDRPEGVSA